MSHPGQFHNHRALECYARERRHLRLSIRADANGRVCGDCRHASFHGATGFCAVNEGVSATRAGALQIVPMRINRRNAVACKDWEAQP